jgi:hypothetical protein
MGRFRTGKRQWKRTKAVVPLRLWIAGSEESHLAHTLDISEHGVQLGGFRGELKVGDKFEIQYRHKRAQFRVVWITAREAPRRSKSGLTALSRRSGTGVLSSPSNRMSTKNENDRQRPWAANLSPRVATPPFVELLRLGGNAQALPDPRAACS